MSDEKPNIVFFFWDNFGWGELGCYGGGERCGHCADHSDRPFRLGGTSHVRCPCQIRLDLHVCEVRPGVRWAASQGRARR